MTCIARALPPRNEWKSRAKEKEKKKKQVEKWAPVTTYCQRPFHHERPSIFFPAPGQSRKSQCNN